MSGQLSREINPSGVGSLIQTDRIQVIWTKEWSPTLSSNINAAAYRSSYVGGVVTGGNSRYYTVEPRLTWRLAEGWVLDAGYARQNYETVSVKASANVVYVNLNYAWPKISVSR